MSDDNARAGQGMGGQGSGGGSAAGAGGAAGGQGLAGQAASRSNRFLGSLKDALVAASRDDSLNLVSRAASADRDAPRKDAQQATPPPLPAAADLTLAVRKEPAAPPSAADAAREVKGQASLKAPDRSNERAGDRHVETDAAPTTRVLKAPPRPAAEDPARTQLVRGRQVPKRGEFAQDPVVGWLVVVGGPGLGSYRPVFEGNNSVGRAATNRIPLDFGDAAISSEEQAYIRYDAADRSFLFVPNLAKTNVVSLNDKRPTGAVVLEAMDVIVMGRTQLVFVPFCGPEFDWSEITDTHKG